MLVHQAFFAICNCIVISLENIWKKCNCFMPINEFGAIYISRHNVLKRRWTYGYTEKPRSISMAGSLVHSYAGTWMANAILPEDRQTGLKHHAHNLHSGLCTITFPFVITWKKTFANRLSRPTQTSDALWGKRKACFFFRQHWKTSFERLKRWPRRAAANLRCEANWLIDVWLNMCERVKCIEN